MNKAFYSHFHSSQVDELSVAIFYRELTQNWIVAPFVFKTTHLHGSRWKQPLLLKRVYRTIAYKRSRWGPQRKQSLYCFGLFTKPLLNNALAIHVTIIFGSKYCLRSALNLNTNHVVNLAIFMVSSSTTDFYCLFRLPTAHSFGLLVLMF
jgi:hypothetical protein